MGVVDSFGSSRKAPKGVPRVRRLLAISVVGLTETVFRAAASKAAWD